MVSLFPNIRLPNSRTLPLETILNGIQGLPPFNDFWKKKVDPIRETYARILAETGDPDQAKKAIKAPKESLAAYTPGGVFHGGHKAQHLQAASGIMPVDLDQLGRDLASIRKAVAAASYTRFLFLSPSGDGLKCGFKYDQHNYSHDDAFLALEAYFLKHYGLQIDQSGKDICRLVFVSSDPSLHRNPQAILFPVADWLPPEKPKPETPPPGSKSNREHKNAAGTNPSAKQHRGAAEQARGGEKRPTGTIQDAPFFAALLADALASIDPDLSRADWIVIGMGLHCWDMVRGLALWVDWSSHGAKFVVDECAREWATFHAEREGGVTIWRVFKVARQFQWDRDPAVVSCLAKLSPLQLDRWLRTCADWLHVTKQALQSAVKVRLGELATDTCASKFIRPEPWPEAVGGQQLLDELTLCAQRFSILPDGTPEVMALWTLHTYAFPLFEYTPRLQIKSPARRCGKSRVLDVLAKLVNCPLLTADATGPVLFRVIERYKPTLLIDEWDSAAHGDKAEDLRNVLNSGFHRNGQSWRIVGDDHEPTGFSTFAPAVVAAIGDLPDTVADRSIPIEMKRKLPQEKVARLRKFDGMELRRKCARWVDDNAVAIQAAEPAIPDGLDDRQADVWEPLFVLADLAGGEWPAKARKIALDIAETKSEASTLSIALLGDIKSIFIRFDTDRISTEDLLHHLCAMDDKPWGSLCDGRPIHAHRLSKLLSGYGISPDSVRIGHSTPKGYTASQFEDAWTRYLGNHKPDLTGDDFEIAMSTTSRTVEDEN